MKAKNLMIAGVLLSFAQGAAAGGTLSGTAKLACEAILCLSSSTTPSECSPSLNKYYSIKDKKFSKQIRKRINFLNACPVVNSDPNMSSLVNAIARGAGKCDPDSLNITNITYSNGYWGQGCISSQLPSYCSAYVNHQYTDLQKLVYIEYDRPQGYWPFQNLGYQGIGGFAGGQRNNGSSCGHWAYQ